MNDFAAARRLMVARVAAVMADAIRRGDEETFETCRELLRPSFEAAAHHAVHAPTSRRAPAR